MHIADLYKDTYEEAQRIIRISDEIRISLEKIENPSQTNEPATQDESTGSSKITSSKLAVKLKLKTPELLERLTSNGYIEDIGGKQALTLKGKTAGGESKSGRFGAYFIWPDNFSPE